MEAILTANGENILHGSGSISHEKASSKAENEYKKYQAKTLSDVEKSFLDTVKEAQKRIK